MLRRLRSAIYGAPDLARAKAFYAALVGKEPYFDQPFYVGFDIDGFELGLDPDGAIIGNANAYWRVDALDPVLALVEKSGGKIATAPRDVGGGLMMATIIDPVGNHIGLIAEPA